MKSKFIETYNVNFTRTTVKDLECLINGKKQIIFLENSIRQMPENYCLAHCSGGCWVCEPDLAANTGLVFFVFEMLLNHELKWDRSAEHIKEALDDAIEDAKAKLCLS